MLGNLQNFYVTKLTSNLKLNDEKYIFFFFNKMIGFCPNKSKSSVYLTMDCIFQEP